VRRIQRQRMKGWRMPEGAIYVGRPGPFGNPFRWDDDRATWLALALGQMADAAGRRVAAVMAYRSWMTDAPMPVPTREGRLGEFEYTSGRVVQVADLPTGMGLLMLSKMGPVIASPRPDLESLRGHDLVCWCPLDQPCHADVLLELANA